MPFPAPLAAFANLSAYKFTPLDGLPDLRARLRTAALAAGLKGTVLLSAEGINLFVAGVPASAQAFLAVVRTIPGLEDISAKQSLSATQPFGRMLVKIKAEIIAFGVAGIDPARHPARKLAPGTLKAWLDAGKAITLLDTRNDYEVARGTFRGAVPAGIKRFRDFPAAVARLDPGLKQQPVVMFCTGGIRCEKAGPYLERAGWDVWQLDGGILRYFEECGAAHFDGECFVFDERAGVDGELRAVATAAQKAGPPADPERRQTPGQQADH